ncbi:zinc ribbon domain-containing protein [Paenibacillus silviterrae]|uniref:zinc ribbon domain-containing protein n=1 Tax=Paenibacillus silviterrae TaxID=3242194 RepID=UPI0025427E93|nr:zinc ribbon domain-containing protein [Paenibacillus chinjuensis]
MNTTEAFRMKMDQLQLEYERKIEPLNSKIEALRTEIKSLNNVGVGAGLGGGVVRFIGTGISVIFGILFIICIIMLFVEPPNGDSEAFLIVGGVLVVLIIGLSVRHRGVSIINKAEARAAEAENKQAQLKAEVIELEKLIQEHHDKLQEELTVQETIYQQHMLNQQQLIEQEVHTINQSAAATDDNKECPQCAETIKAKAKICRFCNYKFDFIEV